MRKTSRPRRWLRPTTFKTVVFAGATGGAMYAAAGLDERDPKVARQVGNVAIVFVGLTAIFGVLSSRPSRGKARALVSASLGGASAFVLGVALASGLDV